MIIHVILPAYNEEHSLSPLLEGLSKRLAETSWNWRAVVVNDGSKDDTLRVCRELAKTYPLKVLDNERNLGLSETLRRGLLDVLKEAAPDDVVVVMDADNTHPAGLVSRMVRIVTEGYDVVIASRYQYGSRTIGVPWHRNVLSVGSSLLCRLLFPIAGVRDYTCGYRAYRVSSLQELQQRFGEQITSESGFSCMLDILLRLREIDAICTEVPMVLRYDRKPGKSKMNVGTTILDSLALLLKRRLFGPGGSVSATSKSYYEQCYPDYQRQNPPAKIDFYLSILDTILEKGDSVFELGCGPGTFFIRASEKYACSGCDVNETGISLLKKALPSAEVAIGSYECISEEPAPAAVVAWDVLEHLPNLKEGLATMYERLPSGGHLVCVVPVYDGPLGWLVHLLDRDPTHVTKTSRKHWLEMIKKAGFSVEDYGGILRKLFGGTYIHITTPQFLLRHIGSALYIVAKKPKVRAD